MKGDQYTFMFRMCKHKLHLIFEKGWEYEADVERDARPGACQRGIAAWEMAGTVCSRSRSSSRKRSRATP